MQSVKWSLKKCVGSSSTIRGFLTGENNSHNTFTSYDLIVCLTFIKSENLDACLNNSKCYERIASLNDSIAISEFLVYVSFIHPRIYHNSRGVLEGELRIIPSMALFNFVPSSVPSILYLHIFFEPFILDECIIESGKWTKR